MKRRFLLQSSLAAALSPFVLRARSQAAENTIWDLVVVGAGTAGLPAAIFAARRGGKVLVIDAAPEIGGTLHIAGGEICGAGTKIQAACGVKDHPDSHFEDVMRLSNGLADPHVVRLTVDGAGQMIDWLDDRGWDCTDDHFITGASAGREGYSVRRYYQGAGAGVDILNVLVREVGKDIANGSVTSLVNTRVTELLTTDAGVVEGVRTNSQGDMNTIRSRHVLLTSGGYAMNPVLFQALVGQPAYVDESYPFSQGDGLTLAANIGAALRGADLHRPGSGSILTSHQWPAKVYARFDTRPQKRPPWEIWVNDRGQRYVNEEMPGRSAREQALLKQPRLRYSILFDDAIFNTAPPGIPGWSRDKMAQHFNSHPMFHKAETLDALAAKAELDPAGLAQTVATYNVSLGSTDPFGREHRPLPIAKPPYYAIVHLGHSATSSVGVSIDKNLNAVRGDGEPIRNLYVAGEALGSGAPLGNAYVPGMMITPAMTLGRYLGMTLPLA